MLVNPSLFRGDRVLVATLLLLLAACVSQPSGPVQPLQSPNDNKAYRLLMLDNQMQVLLISDPDTPKAAAALDVKVGSADNPPERGGLAHFLEHMLFLGTDKYPDPAEYEAFITEHGGTRNAYTSFDNTNYFFDVSSDHLAGALDRFAQFFIAPRFDAEYVDREKNAVQAEYQMGLKSDPRRGLDVLQEVMNPQHPYSQFTVGSLETLADRSGSSVRDELLAFYQKHYSANVMRLVVLGKESLDELEIMAAPLFSQVPNRNYHLPEISASMFASQDLPMLVKIRPQASLRQLEVSFQVPDYRSRYRAKPQAYLGNLVGHEGPGSLLSRLKVEGLAESLGAGAGLAWRGGDLFSVSIVLTQHGAAEYERVLQLLFAYLDMLRKEGPQKALYQEQSDIAALQFRFREDREPIHYVSGLASGMQDYAPVDVLRGPYLMDDYDPVLLQALLNELTPDRALVTLSANEVNTDQISRYYDVPYSRQRIDHRQLQAWLVKDGEPAIHLPASNQFIAEDVSLVEVKEKQKHPLKVLDKERLSIWFMQDSEFRVPRGATYVNFRSTQVGQTPQQTAAAILYTALLKDSVNEFTYPALLAGLNFNLYKHARGISLRISGYNDKQAVLLEHLLSAIARPGFSQERFDNIRADMVRQLQNTIAQRPSSQVIDDLREAVLYDEWGEDALITVLQDMTLADVNTYAHRFWAQASAEAMIYGNYPLSAVDNIAGQLENLLHAGPAPASPPLKVLKLAADERLQLAVDILHDDSVVAWYLQGDGDSWHDRAATALSVQAIKSGFFQQLRTEQQLGYVVGAISWPQMDVPGMVLLIQSPNTPAPEVLKHMDAFMAAAPASIDDGQFERHRAALLAEITRPDKNLIERAEFFWQSLGRSQYDFDSREHLAEAVRKLSLNNWRSYFERVFLAEPHSLQVVAPGRWQTLPEQEGSSFNSARDVKAGHATYSIR